MLLERYGTVPNGKGKSHKTKRPLEYFERSNILENITIGGSDGFRSTRWIRTMLLLPSGAVVGKQQCYRLVRYNSSLGAEPSLIEKRYPPLVS